MNIAIIGAGLSGLSAFYHLKKYGFDNITIFETKDYAGGHASSFVIKVDDNESSKNNELLFYFDEGPHVSFTKDELTKEIFFKGVEGEFIEHKAKIGNFFYGKWIKHPVQCNLHGLDVDLIERCIIDYVSAMNKPKIQPQNYAEWCIQNFGETISKEFIFRYTRKYWTVDANKMSTSWIGPRIYVSSLKDLISGALKNEVEGNHHYLLNFRYPKYGGFGSFTQALTKNVNINFNHQLIKIDLKSNELYFSNGSKANFDKLISSIPLPELINAIDDVPLDVKKHADNLVCTSVILVNIGIKRSDLIDYHWFYVYDDEIPFSRVSLLHKLSPFVVPEGYGSLQAEIYYSKYLPLWDTIENLKQQTIEGFKKMNIIKSDDEIVFVHTKNIKYANVLYDLNRDNSLKVILDYLDEIGILTCGRYGEWEYFWTDDAINSGKRIADKIKNIKS